MIEFIIERTKGKFIAKCSSEQKFTYNSPKIDSLKNKIVRDLESKLGYVPPLLFRYSLKSYLTELRPFLRYSLIANYAGLTSVTLSYYISGERNPTEQSFFQTISAVQQILHDLKLYK